MTKDSKVYMRHMLEAIESIESYINNISENNFYKNKMIQDAVVRNLEIIGEAAKNVVKLTRDKYPDIEWKRIAGLRDVLIHEYFGVDIEKVWRIVEGRLPDLKKKLRRIVNEK